MQVIYHYKVLHSSYVFLVYMIIFIVGSCIIMYNLYAIEHSNTYGYASSTIISMVARQNLTRIFDENEIFAEICFWYQSL